MAKFCYVYVLRSLRDKGLYVGSTRDLETRLRLHNDGAVRSTSPRRPFELIFYEAHRSDATLATVLDRTGAESLSELLRRGRR
ncbi:MAG: GIY-YIG nuclease family protein [Terriglobia bacterium]|jgi:predicted GIY-YIG superfamily endonuclease